MTKNFALTGASGYVAPRHLKAIKETGNRLVAALDPHDSAGVVDSYFDDAVFFTEFERFDRHIEKLRRLDGTNSIHYVSICSPNYLHDAHARFALRIGADVICEKPLVLNPWNLDALAELERESGGKIYTVLQLRVHPSLIALRESIQKEALKAKKEIELTYITSRGPWYLVSWKGQLERSGGLATNIGIHFFDLLMWLFGPVERSDVYLSLPTKTSGYLELKDARVRWYLSIDKNDLPQEALDKNQRTFRSITIDGEEVEFSEGFTDLHTIVYRETLAGRGFGLEQARPSIELVHDIRNSKPVSPGEAVHPALRTLR
ncbi:MAG: Gfo/Idh/MocA family oxidoreductase [Candidatus Zixiibacteriota bacterium]|nr:MAG: Gfo/Idh/MocA family oxidoreductase [candidate division Zixibacteria bacterium]